MNMKENVLKLNNMILGQPIHIPIVEFLFSIVLGALLAFLLGKLYVVYGQSLSNRERFSRNFVMLTTTTVLIIAVVKSSLALSLGLIGALSIVRFRAPIKEPEELIYLFLAIAIGLGLGANQLAITSVAFLVISAIIVVKNRAFRVSENKNMFLTVSYLNANESIDLQVITSELKQYCSSINLRRYDESGDRVEALFVVDFKDVSELYKCRNKLSRDYGDLHLTFLDNREN